MTRFKIPVLLSLFVLAGIVYGSVSKWRGTLHRHHRHSCQIAEQTFAFLTADQISHKRPRSIRSIEIALGYLLAQSPPFLFMRYQVDGRTLVEVGDVPKSFQLIHLQGHGDESREGVRMIWGPLHPLPTDDPQEQYEHYRDRERCLATPVGVVAPGTPSLVVGMRHRPPRHLLHMTIQGIVVGTLIVLIAWCSLLIAWFYNVRRRASEVQLRIEQQRQGHFEDLSIAAAGLAHETKNPLGIIIGLAQQISRTATEPEEIQTYADYIIDEAERATVRLSEFMAYAEWRTPEFQEIDVKALFVHLCSVLRLDFEHAGVHLVHRVAHPDCMVSADETMLSQILTNLLINALQATESGGEVAMTYDESKDGGVLCVRDSGCGIEPERLSEIVKPYVTYKDGGHGLGLALVKRMVDIHHWTFGVQSVRGEGTTIRIDIPKERGVLG